MAKSDAAAALLGLSPADFSRPGLVAALTGNVPVAGADPLAAVYSGHQFGVYVPRLGDGRALLLGEVVGPDERRWEVQLKGAGKTPYSRMGDGRAVLRSSIREFLASEAMQGLGIPTTRALAVTGSDFPVIRESVETAAVVTRLAPSFVRFGSFEYFYWTEQHDALSQLADFVIDRFYPDARASAQPYLALLEQVARRTARLVAQWQGVGFCHGVLNTDNMSILGLTIDYGPYGFLDAFDAGHICNHSDEHGRYSYKMQPQIGHWNLYALGQALVPLTDDLDATKAAIDVYLDEYAQAIDAVFRAKLGLATERPGMPSSSAGRSSCSMRTGPTGPASGGNWRSCAVTPLIPMPMRPCATSSSTEPPSMPGRATYRAASPPRAATIPTRAARMNRVNPKYVLRNHLAETAIRKARGDDGPRDFTEVARLLESCSNTRLTSSPSTRSTRQSRPTGHNRCTFPVLPRNRRWTRSASPMPSGARSSRRWSTP